MSDNYTKQNRDVLDYFFNECKNKPWGKLITAQVPVSFLKKWRDNEPIIENSIREVVERDGWQDELSRDFSNGGSSDPRFFLFKQSVLFHSIGEIGLKTPLHLHHVPTDNELSVHPSNNKIECLCEFYQDLTVNVLYHDYDYLNEYWPDQLTGWYKQFEHREIDNTDDYLKLFGLEHESNETEFGFENVKEIVLNKDSVWGKVKPRANDWKYIDITEKPAESLDNALFLTVTDRFHRRVMHEDNIKMGDILIPAGDNQYMFCDKIFTV
jgi:hypothetical protein